MMIDITLKVTPQMITDAQGNEKKALTGHLGTHFDGMDKEFPLDLTELEGIVFDISGIQGRDIEIGDIDPERIRGAKFIAFYSGFLERVGYGSETYFAAHPQLSNELIDRLLQEGARIIGIDFAGVRRGREHTPKDQYCADRGTFIVENLCNLKPVVEAGGRFLACTYPMNFSGMTGLPCRVVARV